MNTHLSAGLCSVFVLGSIVFLGVPNAAWAQDSLNQVHVLPHPHTTRPKLPPDLKANVDLVLVPVTVLDRADRTVTGLHADNFAVLDNKIAQTIKYFSSEDTPIALTVIVDASGSMSRKVQQVRTAAMQLFKAANPQDEFRLMTFGDEPRTASNLAGPVDDVQTMLTDIRPHGLTALWDTMYLAIMDLKQAQYERKAIILISDGGDNHSRHTQSEIKSLLKEADVQVYALGVFDRNPRTREERIGPLLLDEVATVTGGRMFSVYDRTALGRAVTEVSLELRNQYVLGYYPSTRERNGKWRTLKIQLVATPTPARLRVYARKGYYGPVE